MQKRIDRIGLILLTVMLQVTLSFAQTQSSQRLRFLTSGLPEIGKQHAESVVAARWGIELYPAAGCIVNTKLSDSIRQENEKVRPLFDARYGKNWWAKFSKEVDKEYLVEKIIFPLVDSLTYVRRKKAEMDSLDYRLDYVLTPIPKSTKYYVSVVFPKIQNPEEDFEWVTFCKLVINYQTKSVKLISRQKKKA